MVFHKHARSSSYRIVAFLWVGFLVLLSPLSSIDALSAELSSEAKETFDLAFGLMKKGNVREAEVLYEKAIRLAPDANDVWMEYGSCLRKINRIQRSVRAYWRALEVEPEDSSTWSNLGNAFVQAKSWDSAMDAFQIAETLSSDKPWAIKNFLNVGFTLWTNGNFDQAMKVFQYAYQLDPQNAQTILDMGITLVSEGKMEEGLDQIHKAIPLLEKDGNRMGVAYAEAALAYIKKNGRLDPPQQDMELYQHLPERFLNRPPQGQALSLEIDSTVKRFIQIHDNHLISIETPESWHEMIEDNSDQKLPTISFQPDLGDDFKLMLSFMKSKRGIEEIKNSVQNSGSALLEGSLETHLELVTISSKFSRGYAYLLTDKSLVGKKAKEGDFPYIVQGIVKASEVEIFFSVLTRSKDQKSVDQMLDIIKNITPC